MVEQKEKDFQAFDAEEIILEQPAEQKPEKEIALESQVQAQSEQQLPNPQAVVSSVQTDDQTISTEDKDPEQQEIENILAEGLEDLYSQMPPARQVEFRKAGEETASKIKVLLDSAKVQVHKIVDLIKKWLSMIPSVNKFFLEQESKIKADRLLERKGIQQ